jgi:ribonuclease HII
VLFVLVSMTAQLVPTLDQESRLWRDGFRHIAGIDEVGRGALAGPVVAAAVMLPPGAQLAGVWATVRDSKLLTPAQRQALVPQIQATALAWGIGSAAPTLIDQQGIAAATRWAMQQAIAALTPPPDYLLIDWVKLPGVKIAQTSLIKADRDIVSVAAASILAKVYRDELMIALHATYPVYHFHQHKGYGAATHLAALAEHGPCAEHRHSFAPIAQSAPTLFEQAGAYAA